MNTYGYIKIFIISNKIIKISCRNSYERWFWYQNIKLIGLIGYTLIDYMNPYLNVKRERYLSGGDTLELSLSYTPRSYVITSNEIKNKMIIGNSEMLPKPLTVITIPNNIKFVMKSYKLS